MLISAAKVRGSLKKPLTPAVVLADV